MEIVEFPNTPKPPLPEKPIVELARLYPISPAERERAMLSCLKASLNLSLGLILGFILYMILDGD